MSHAPTQVAALISGQKLYDFPPQFGRAWYILASRIHFLKKNGKNSERHTLVLIIISINKPAPGINK